MAITLESLLEKGFQPDEIMELARNPLFAPPETNAADQTGAATPAPATTPAPVAPVSQSDVMMQLFGKLFEQQTQLITALATNNQPPAAPEPSKTDQQIAEEAARQFSDEKLKEALQKLNLTTKGDNIDIGEDVEHNMVKHLGSLVGVKIEDKKEG